MQTRRTLRASHFCVLLIATSQSKLLSLAAMNSTCPCRWAERYGMEPNGSSRDFLRPGASRVARGSGLLVGMEIRISNIETNSNAGNPKSKTRKCRGQSAPSSYRPAFSEPPTLRRELGSPVLNFRHLYFEFVSDFDIRYSTFPRRRTHVTHRCQSPPALPSAC